MKEYCVTKYDPQYRINGIYTRNEWCGKDIGKEFVDGVLTLEEYESTLRRYAMCATEVLEHAGIAQVKLVHVEKHRKIRPPKENTIVPIDKVGEIVFDCLDEKYWCSIEADNAYIRIGYDLYMHIGCNLETDEISTICEKYRMFAVEQESPYKYDDSDDEPGLPMRGIFLTAYIEMDRRSGLLDKLKVVPVIHTMVLFYYLMKRSIYPGYIRSCLKALLYAAAFLLAFGFFIKLIPWDIIRMIGWFINVYCIVLWMILSARKGIRKINDLKNHENLCVNTEKTSC